MKNYYLFFIKKAFFLGYCSLRINDTFFSLPHYLDPIAFSLKKTMMIKEENL